MNETDRDVLSQVRSDAEYDVASDAMEGHVAASVQFSVQESRAHRTREPVQRGRGPFGARSPRFLADPALTFLGRFSDVYMHSVEVAVPAGKAPRDSRNSLCATQGLTR